MNDACLFFNNAKGICTCTNFNCVISNVKSKNIEPEEDDAENNENAGVSRHSKLALKPEVLLGIKFANYNKSDINPINN